MRRYDFDANLAPYDLSSYATWQSLSRHITAGLCTNVSSGVGNLCCSFRAPRTTFTFWMLWTVSCGCVLCWCMAASQLLNAQTQDLNKQSPFAPGVVERLSPVAGGNICVTAEADPSLLAPRTAAEARLSEQLASKASTQGVHTSFSPNITNSCSFGRRQASIIRCLQQLHR